MFRFSRFLGTHIFYLIAMCGGTSIASEIPETISLERAYTLNGYGYVFYNPSPLLSQFIETEGRPDNVLIEIGAGFGNAPLECLKKGVLEYTANDLSEEHLDILSLRLQEESRNNFVLDLSRLVLLPGHAPEILPAKNKYYDAVLIDKVLHFMTPDEIEVFLGWAQKALKAEGKIYVLTISPYIKSFRDNVLPMYLENKKQGMPFAGHVNNVADLIRLQSTSAGHYRLPDEMTFFDLEDLTALFQQHGFDVFETFSLYMPTEEHPQWIDVSPDESALVGIIAKVKNNRI